MKMSRPGLVSVLVLLAPSGVLAQLGLDNGSDLPRPPGQVRTGATVRADDVRSPAFWRPAGRGGNDRLPVLGPTGPIEMKLDANDRPWTGTYWPSADAALALRGSASQSPLEKYDTLYADQTASSPAAMVNSLFRGRSADGAATRAGAAAWEADPDNQHNTAAVVGADGNASRYYRKVDERLPAGTRVEVSGGQATPAPVPANDRRARILYQGEVFETQRYLVANTAGTRIDAYYFPFRPPAGTSASGDLYNRFCRVPAEAVEPDASRAQWYLVTLVPGTGAQAWVETEKRITGVERLAADTGNAGSGSVQIRIGDKTYAIASVEIPNETHNLDGVAYPFEMFWYRPTGLPELPGQEGFLADKWSCLTRLPPRGRTPEPPGGPIWFHMRYEVANRGTGAAAWDGHCNGWSAGSVLFKEPPARRSYDLRHSTLLRLRASAATQAYRDNLAYQAVPAGSNRIELDRGDLKGLASELGMSVRVTFETGGTQEQSDFGTRADERDVTAEAPAWRDIHPHHLHRILVEYISERKRPLVGDFSTGAAVWNYPVWGYTWSIKSHHPRGEGNDPRPFYRMQATIFRTSYGDRNALGTTEDKASFDFELVLDPTTNRVVDSRWTGTSVTNHPDFLWAPYDFAPPVREVSRVNRNPNLDPEFVLSRILTDEQGASLLRDWVPARQRYSR